MDIRWTDIGLVGVRDDLLEARMNLRVGKSRQIRKAWMGVVCARQPTDLLAGVILPKHFGDREVFLHDRKKESSSGTRNHTCLCARSRIRSAWPMR